MTCAFCGKQTFNVRAVPPQNGLGKYLLWCRTCHLTNETAQLLTEIPKTLVSYPPTGTPCS